MDQENESPLPSPREAGRGLKALLSGCSGPGEGPLWERIHRPLIHPPKRTGPPSPHGAGRRLFFHPKYSRLITFAHFMPVFYLRALSGV